MPLTYTLVLEIDDTSLRTITARNMRVVLAKAAGGSPPSAIWLAWPPVHVNTIHLNDTCGVYAGDVPDGRTIRVRAIVYPALDRAVHPFSGTAFGEPVIDRGLPSSHYDISNAGQASATVGLVQFPTVNGAVVMALANAVVLPQRCTANFSGVTRVYAWIQSGVVEHSLAVRIPPCATEITFAAGEMKQRYRYDTNTETFVSSDGLS